MTKWIRFLLISLLILTTFASVMAQEEINSGESIEGEASDEITEYEVELELGQVVEITIEANWDTYLELYDEDGELIAYDDDGGDGTQSRLVYSAEYTGAYVIRVRAFGGETPAGDYTLSVTSIDVEQVIDAGELEYGNDEGVDADDALAIEATFEGEAGDVIDILTVSDNYLNTTMVLLDPSGDEVAESTSSYGDAQILRYELEDSGTYTIHIEEGLGGILDGDIEIEVQLTEVLSLDEGDVTVEIGDGVDTLYVNFSAEDNVMYELTLMLDDEPDYSEMTISILTEDQNLDEYSDLTMRMRGGIGMIYIFEANDDGEFVIRLEYYGSDDIDVTLSIEEIDQ